MPSEQVRFILESIASIAAIAALVAIALELQRARRADTRDFLFYTHEKYHEIRKTQDYLLGLNISNVDDLNKGDKKTDAWMSVYGFWELICRTTQAKAIDKDIVIEQYARPFLRFYDKLADVVHERIEEQGGLDWFSPVDWFANETYKRYPSEVKSMKNEEGNNIFSIR